MTNAANDGWVTGDAYDAYMGRWSRLVAQQFIEWLRPNHSADWLEIGCGTGALTSQICALCQPASVIACDPSKPFIDYAQHTFSDRRASFVVANDEKLPTPDNGFDAIVSGLVLNFLPDARQAVMAMRERLRPQGVVAAYVWDYGEGMEFLRYFWDEAAAADPRAAVLDEGRRFPLCREPELATLFRAAGLSDVRTAELQIPTDFAGFEDYWSPFLRGTGPAPSYVASLDEPARTSLRARLQQRLPVGSTGRLHLRARAWAVRGARSA